MKHSIITKSNRFSTPIITLFFVILFLLLGLVSCGPSAISKPLNLTATVSSPTGSVNATPGPSPTPANCLVGIWEIKDRKSYLFASVPIGAFEPSVLKFMGTVGSVGMRFFNNGIIAVQADNFMGRFDVNIEDRIQTLDIKMNGFVNGKYTLDGDRLTILDTQRNEMTYEATLGDETMMSEVDARKFLPLFAEPYTIANVSCGSETLTINIINFPANSSPLQFTRLR